MTEKTLEKATETKHKLDIARKKRNDIKEKADLCSGNYSEVANRDFQITITQHLGTIVGVINVSSRAADLALAFELGVINETIKELEKEFEGLK